jgi:ribose transport system permease protein
MDNILARRLLDFASHGVAVAYALLAFLVIAAFVYDPGLASWSWIHAQLQIAAFIGIIAIGQTMVNLIGRYLYAIGNNETALFVSGVDSRKVVFGAFMVSGFGAALAGILLTGYASQTYLGMGNDYLLIPIAAVIIGGTNVMGGSGGYVGTIAGALIVVILQSLLSTAQIGQAGKDVVFGVIILALVLLYAREARPTD